MELNARGSEALTTDVPCLGLDVPGLTHCLGSDAHVPGRIGERLEHLAALLADHGFVACPDLPGRYARAGTAVLSQG